MATLKQVADRAGVSRRTVDRVMNQRGTVSPETAERVREALKELNYQPDQAGQVLAAKKKKIRLAFCSIKGEQSVIHEEIRQGAIRKARELKKMGITVDFYTINRDCPMSEEEEQRLVEAFQCDGLATLPIDDSTINQLIDKAENMNIPIVFYNMDHDSYKRSCYVGCDYYKSGRLAAGLMGLCMESDLKVGIFTVGKNDASFRLPSYHNRVQGFEQEIVRKFPQIEIVGQYLLGQDIFDYYDTIKRVMCEQPDLNAIYLVNPGDYSVCRAIKKVMEQKKIKLITNDITTEAMALLKEGTISATISQDPESQGALPLELLFEQLVFARNPEQEMYYTDLHIYIPQNFN